MSSDGIKRNARKDAIENNKILAKAQRRKEILTRGKNLRRCEKKNNK